VQDHWHYEICSDACWLLEHHLHAQMLNACSYTLMQLNSK